MAISFQRDGFLTLLQKLVLSARNRPQKKSLERGIKSKEKFAHIRNKKRGTDLLVSTIQ